MTEAKPLSAEWIADMLFDHLAAIGADVDKWKRIEALRTFGHQFKATITSLQAEIERLRQNQRTPQVRCKVCGYTISPNSGWGCLMGSRCPLKSIESA